MLTPPPVLRTDAPGTTYPQTICPREHARSTVALVATPPRSNRAALSDRCPPRAPASHWSRIDFTGRRGRNRTAGSSARFERAYCRIWVDAPVT
jgi:hypothetical protein